MKKILTVTALTVLSLNLLSCLKVTDMRLFTDESIKSSVPVVEYYTGRHRFVVPQYMNLKGFNFFIGAAEPQTGKRYATEYIRIEEIPWKPGNKEQQFKESWFALRESARETQARRYPPAFRNKKGKLQYAENPDAQNIFGHQAVTIASTFGGYPYSIRSFIALPQGLLKLTEKRGVGNVPPCTDIEIPAANLLRHYQWGKRPSSDPDTFYTALGMTVGIPSKYEEANIFFDHPDGFFLRILSRYTQKVWSIPGVPDGLPSEDQVAAKARKMGISYQSYIRRERQFAGQNMIEHIYRAREDSDSDYSLYFLIRSAHERGFTAIRPRIEITLECEWAQREQAMEIWNTVLQGFRLAAESSR